MNHSKLHEEWIKIKDPISQINTSTEESSEHIPLNSFIIDTIDNTKQLLSEALWSGAQIFVDRYESLLEIIQKLKKKIQVLEWTPCTCIVQNWIAINSLKNQLKEGELEIIQLKVNIELLRKANNSIKTVNKELKIAKNRDNLTWALSRSYYDDMLWKLQDDFNTKVNTNFTIVILDIDHFKKFNDMYGHPVWDIALKYFVSTFRSFLEEWDHINNSTDWFFRIWWEEFALLTRRSIKDTIDLVTCILNEFKQLKLSNIQGLSHISKLSHITFSAWIWWSYLMQEFNNLTWVISEIDKALYQSKGRWRACITTCSENVFS